MNNVKGLRFTILHTGYIWNDKSLNVALTDLATKDNPNRRAEWIKVPSIAILIDHPTEGYILYDGGSRKGDLLGGPNRPERHVYGATPFIDDDQWVECQLEKIGLTLHDLSCCIISHYHWDHVGVLEELAGTKAAKNIYVSKKDYAYGLVETHKEKKDMFCTYMYQNYELPGLDFKLVEEDCAFCEGIEFIILPGHTPGVLGLVVHAESGTYIFPDDSLYTQQNYETGGHFPGLIYDRSSFFETVRKVEHYQRKYNGTIIYPHDMQQFEQLKIAPHWY